MPSNSTLELIPGRVALDDIRRLLGGTSHVHLAADVLGRLDAGAAALRAVAAKGDPVYGLNTGFGKLAKTRIPFEKLSELQVNLVRSHAAGVGAPLEDRVVRTILFLKANALARVHSGVRGVVVETLLALLRHEVLPVIPCKGSVGASGDLAPLAHLSLVLIGEGSARCGDRIIPGTEALAVAGVAPLQLGPKEGLALLNGTQVSTAIALVALLDAEQLLQTSLIVGALTVDAAKGSDTPFDPRLHELRGHRGQVDCAAAYRGLLAGSAIRASHLVDDERVQDPYCLRCQPQVAGACLDQLRYVACTLETEANAVSDNPIHFPDTGELLSGGNFHAEPVAFAADAAAVAIAEIGAISERRTAMLVDQSMSGLPPFLTRDSGLNSGFMIAQVTAAALASENKSLAHPASVDSLPTSANQEDHVSMATFAARRLGAMITNTRAILAIELLSAAQGIDLLAPLATSAPLQAVWRLVRAKVAVLGTDRVFGPDIDVIDELIRSGAVVAAAGAARLPSVGAA